MRQRDKASLQKERARAINRQRSAALNEQQLAPTRQASERLGIARCRLLKGRVTSDVMEGVYAAALERIVPPSRRIGIRILDDRYVPQILAALEVFELPDVEFVEVRR